MDISFHHPFTSIVAGPTRSGKTEWAKKFVQNVPFLMDIKPERIIWCYSEYQPSYNELLPHAELIEGIPDMALLKTPEPKLVVFDDFMTEFSKKPELTALFTKGCHHWNTSAIHIVQNMFYENLRCARINSHYLVLLKNPADKLQIMNLGRQLYPHNAKYFQHAYDDACNYPYGYLLVDVSPECCDDIRLRTCIFPNDMCCYAYVPK